MERNKSKVEVALDNVKGVSNDTEVYPDPETERDESKYKKAFRHNSTFVITTHFLKALLSPAILAMPSGFRNGGLIFSIFGYLFILFIVAFNMKNLTENASYLSARESTTIRTYDQVAFVSFNSCSPKTKPMATFFKNFVNILFIVTYLDACSIFMIFLARNLEAIIQHHVPGTCFNVYHLIFLQVIWLMIMSSIRDLKYLAPFSFVACILVLSVVILTSGFYLVPNIPDPNTRVFIGNFPDIYRFTSVVSFSLSGISISLALKSSMIHPEKFFSCPGVYCASLVVLCLTFIPFGFLGYLSYGDQTLPSIMMNLPVNEAFALVVRALAMASVFLTSPLVFFVAFNVAWNNYIKMHVNSVNVMFAEYFGRYCFITISCLLAMAIPDLGIMIVLKGSLLHSHLEIVIPAILDYVTYYPVEGNGKCGFRLLRLVFSVTFGCFLCVSGATVGLIDLVTLFNNSTRS